MAEKSDSGPFSVVPEWVTDADISDRAHRLYTVLARYADQEGTCWPSRTTLATRLRCSADSVDRAKQELRDAGALEWDQQVGADGALTSNRYRLLRVPTRTAAATGTRTGAAENETHVELEPENTRAEDLLLLEQEDARDLVGEDFARAWAEYPRKTARKRAEKAYRATRERGPTAKGLLAAVQNYAREREGKDQAYTMHGATFFGPDERWRDYGYPVVNLATGDIVAPPALVDHEELARRAAQRPPDARSRPVTTAPWEATQ